MNKILKHTLTQENYQKILDTICKAAREDKIIKNSVEEVRKKCDELNKKYLSEGETKKVLMILDVVSGDKSYPSFWVKK